MLSDHIKQYIALTFQTDGCLLLHESSTESRSFLCYLHSAISSHLSIRIFLSPEWMVAKNRFDSSKGGHCLCLYFSLKAYVMDTHKNCQREAILTSTLIILYTFVLMKKCQKESFHVYSLIPVRRKRNSYYAQLCKFAHVIR